MGTSKEYVFYLVCFLIVTLLFIFIVVCASAEEINWDTLVNAVIQVESSGDPNAYNKKSGATGLMQITNIALKEYNENCKEDNIYFIRVYHRNYGLLHVPYYKTFIHRFFNKSSSYYWKKKMLVSSTSDLSNSDLYNININAMVGTWYLKRIYNHYLPHYKLEQSLENICIAYNFGIGNLVKYRQGKVKLPNETKQYIRKVRELYEAN